MPEARSAPTPPPRERSRPASPLASRRRGESSRPGRGSLRRWRAGAPGDADGPQAPDGPGAAGDKEDLPERPLSIVAVGLSSAASSFLVGLLLVGAFVLAAWALDSRSSGSMGDAARAAAGAWLVAHLVPVTIHGIPFGLAPLGVTAVSLTLVFRSATHAARSADVSGAGQAVRLGAAAAAGFGVLGLVLVAPVSTLGVEVSPLRAFAAPYLLAFAAATAGALRGAGRWRDLRRRLPEQALAAAGMVLWALVGAGALLTGLSLALRHQEVLALLRDLDAGAGPGGLAMILLVSLAYLPNAIVWAASFVTGAGFAVGSGGLVSPFEVTAGELPSFPLLAAVPQSGPSAPTWLVLLVPLVAAGMAGYAVRNGGGGRPVLRTAGVLLVTTVLTAGVSGVAAALASGPAGAEALRHLGPLPLVTAAFVGVETLVGGILGALVRPAADPAAARVPAQGARTPARGGAVPADQ